MSETPKTYSADAWTFNYAGLAVESGKGPDEFLKSEHVDAESTMTVGLDGSTVFNQIKNKSRKMTLTLLATSKGNAVLSAYYNAHRRTEGGLPAPLFVEDRLGTTKEISSAAVIEFMPDFAAGKEAGVIVWSFLVADAETFVGSH